MTEQAVHHFSAGTGLGLALFGVLPRLDDWSPALTVLALIAITVVTAGAAQIVIAMIPRDHRIQFDPAWDEALEELSHSV